MATEHQILHGPISHLGTLEARLNDATAEGFEVAHFAATSGDLHILLTRATKDDEK
jgi:hypothetical protein